MYRLRSNVLPVLFLTGSLFLVPQVEDFGEDEAVETAKRALSDEVGILESRLESYQVLAAQWRDSSLGCPRPGMVYLPALTRGYRVFLREVDASSPLYEVHVTASEAVVCETADPDVERTLPKAESDARAQELRNAPSLARWARQDLASRLGVDPADIVVTVRPRTWLDTSLGCPEEGQSYQEARIEGFLILLQVNEDTYSYHADSESVFFCEEPVEPER